MVQKESEAHIVVLHSTNTTSMPDKETVCYRNGRKHHLGFSFHLVSYMQHEYGFLLF